MTPTIEALGLKKRYGKTQALNGLDLIAERGQVVAVLGPNGAGKTTFVRAVATLPRLDEGALRVAGHDVRSRSGRGAPGHRAGRTVRGDRAGDDRPREPRDGRPPVRSGSPGGEGAARTPCSNSSGCAKPPIAWPGPTRAACAGGSTWAPAWSVRRGCSCSTSRRPDSIPRSRIELWDAIRHLVQHGTDVLLTTQYLDEADHLADQVVIVDHGRAVATGTPAELKARIGGNVIELHVRHEQDLAAVAELLGRFDRRGAQIDEPTRRVSVRVDAGRDRLMAAMRSIDAAGVDLEDIALRQPNLDEVFLALTGDHTDSAARAA